MNCKKCGYEFPAQSDTNENSICPKCNEQAGSVSDETKTGFGIAEFINVVLIIALIGTLIDAAFIIWKAADTSSPISAGLVEFKINNFGKLTGGNSRQMDLAIDDAAGTLIISNADYQLRIVLVLLELVKTALILAVLYLLYKILASLGKSGPFAADNTPKIRSIAGITMIFSPYYFVMKLVTFLWLRPASSIEDIHILRNINFDLEYIFMGLLILIIAEVFKLGSQMKTEQQLTI